MNNYECLALYEASNLQKIDSEPIACLRQSYIKDNRSLVMILSQVEHGPLEGGFSRAPVWNHSQLLANANISH